MKKNIILITLALVFLMSFQALGAKRKKRKWSMTVSNGYTFYSMNKIDREGESPEHGIGTEGQMNFFFSNLELRRNFGNYEVGGKIQLFHEAFISPFIKINFAKNISRTAVIPYLTLGVVPARLTGAYMRFGLDIAINRYFSLGPYVGGYAWHKIKNSPYERFNVQFNGGLNTTLYF